VNKLTAAVIVGFSCGILVAVRDILVRYLKLDISPFNVVVMVLIAHYIYKVTNK
jgi:hypothetical protein